MPIKENYGLKKVWYARHRISEKCDFDTEKLIKYYQKKQLKHKNRLVSSTINTPHMVSEKPSTYNNAKQEGENSID